MNARRTVVLRIHDLSFRVSAFSVSYPFLLARLHSKSRDWTNCAVSDPSPFTEGRILVRSDVSREASGARAAPVRTPGHSRCPASLHVGTGMGRDSEDRLSSGDAKRRALRGLLVRDPCCRPSRR